MSEMIKGVTLFIVCLALYCLQMLIVKIFMQKFHISAFEVTYQFCAPLVLFSYIGIKMTAPKSTDFLNIPRDMFWPLLGRCTCGFLTEVTIFLAFTYTSYSKAFCIHKMESLFSPFIAYYTMREPVKSADLMGILLCISGMLLLLQPWRT
jgi:drug/metabolite transporter (DMT)-like permease